MEQSTDVILYYVYVFGLEFSSQADPIFRNRPRSLIQLPHLPRTSLRPTMPPRCTENSSLSPLPNPAPTHLLKNNLRSRAASRSYAVDYRTRCQSRH
jgi:hypothetical protein